MSGADNKLPAPSSKRKGKEEVAELIPVDAGFVESTTLKARAYSFSHNFMGSVENGEVFFFYL